MQRLPKVRFSSNSGEYPSSNAARSLYKRHRGNDDTPRREGLVSAKGMSLRAAAVIMVVVTLLAIQSPPATSQETGADTPAPLLQIWQINLNRLKRNWQGFIERIALSGFKPDIILVQELCNCADGTGSNDLNVFMDALNARFSPTSYQAEHGASAGQNFSVSTFAVIWRTDRFTQQGEIRWPAKQGSSCTTNEKTLVAVDLMDSLVNKNVRAASLHYPPGLTQSCLTTNIDQVHVQLEQLNSIGRLTVLGGDFNQRPDKDKTNVSILNPETPAEGLEADPDCWYRRLSGPHLNTTVVGQQNCASPYHDAYVDTVWASVVGGGYVNPMIPYACEQFTYSNDLGFPVDPNDAVNSCTDVIGGTPAGPNGVLDQGRIDYIWMGAETSDGFPIRQRPDAYTGTFVSATSWVQFATADLGLGAADLQSLTSYSDHRGVQALIRHVDLPST